MPLAGHYSSSKAALALVRKLEGLVGVTVDATDLEEATADYERQVSLAVQSDPEVREFVDRLEQAAADQEPDVKPGDKAAERRLEQLSGPAGTRNR